MWIIHWFHNSLESLDILLVSLDLGNCEYWVTVVIVAPNEVRTDVSQVTMPGNDRLQDVIDINWSELNIASTRFGTPLFAKLSPSSSSARLS